MKGVRPLRSGTKSSEIVSRESRRRREVTTSCFAKDSPSHHGSDLLDSKLKRSISDEEDGPSSSSLLRLLSGLSGSESGSNGPSDGSPKNLRERDGSLGERDVEDTEG